MKKYLNNLGNPKNIKIVKNNNFSPEKNVTYFNVENRTYNKLLTTEEINFMKFLLPEKAKFIPITYD